MSDGTIANMSGYHLNEITKGSVGEFSKIREEFEELEDAFCQRNKVLQICELCDLLGAIEAFAKKFDLTLEDLTSMMELTKKSFLDGTRK